MAEGAVERLKFAEALPEAVAHTVVERRMRADDLVRTLRAAPVRRMVDTA